MMIKVVLEYDMTKE